MTSDDWMELIDPDEAFTDSPERLSKNLTETLQAAADWFEEQGDDAASRALRFMAEKGHVPRPGGPLELSWFNQARYKERSPDNLPEEVFRNLDLAGHKSVSDWWVDYPNLYEALTDLGLALEKMNCTQSASK
jgi:hypothetical protein